MGTRIARSSWAQDAWRNLLENEAKDPQWVQSEEYDYHIEYELIVELHPAMIPTSWKKKLK